MELLNVYVGRPRPVTYNGKLIQTGIFKELLKGEVRVTKLNLEGDQQADLKVHGGMNKAVYAYPFEHYAFWKNKFPELDFEGSAFGENLSVKGLLEEEVCIGDKFDIGSARLQVTTPRMPCFKLGIKMNNPAFIGDFLEEGRNGFYFKVLKEGIIKAGDSIKLVHRDSYGLTVDETIRAYHKERKNKKLLEKAAQSPSLPEDWKLLFEQKLLRL